MIAYPETNCKIVAFLRSYVPLNTFATGFFTRCFSIWLCSFQGTFSGLSHASHVLGFRRGFFKSFAPLGSLSLTLRIFKNLSIPENDTSSRRTFQSTPDSSSGLFSLLHLSVYRPEMKRSDFSSRFLPRKEVIQPHLPIRLPCYDFTPVIGLTFDSWLLSVTSLASGAPNSHGVTGGVYKARERIHRGMLIRDY